MTGHPRLYRRGATYYHRAAIPVDIKGTYPKTEETFSLKTSNYQQALKLVRIAAAETDSKFEKHRRQIALQTRPYIDELSDNQIKRLGDMYFASRLDEDEETRLEGFYDPDDVNAELHPTPRPTFDEYSELGEAMTEDNKHNYARGKADPFFIGEAEDILSWDGVDINLSPTSSSLKKLARELQAASIRAAKSIKARNEGEVVETPSSAAMAPIGSTTIKLSAAIEQWADEKARTTWVPKTEKEHRIWMSHFVDIAGDHPINEYTKAHGRAFKNVLLNLPPNWTKHTAIASLPIEQAAAKAKELSIKPMSEKNVNKLIGFVGSFWNWAEDNYDDAPLNPLKGLKIKLRADVREERDPFTTEELNTIFRAPLFTGCKSERDWKSSGALTMRESGRFWVPLIALFTGARLGEIIQLYVEDVREENGILHFDINKHGDDKRLKNANSKRIIPVHAELINFGLLKHIETQKKAKSQRLFPDLPMGYDGYYSSPFSKFFNNFLIACGVRHPKNAFHSFRHSFEDACRDSDISKEIMDALQGHGEHGMSKRYGKGYFLVKLNEAMAKLHYRSLDLSHLKDTRD